MADCDISPCLRATAHCLLPTAYRLTPSHLLTNVSVAGNNRPAGNWKQRQYTPGYPLSAHSFSDAFFVSFVPPLFPSCSPLVGVNSYDYGVFLWLKSLRAD